MDPAPVVGTGAGGQRLVFEPSLQRRAKREVRAVGTSTTDFETVFRGSFVEVAALRAGLEARGFRTVAPGASDDLLDPFRPPGRSGRIELKVPPEEADAARATIDDLRPAFGSLAEEDLSRGARRGLALRKDEPNPPDPAAVERRRRRLGWGGLAVLLAGVLPVIGVTVASVYLVLVLEEQRAARRTGETSMSFAVPLVTACVALGVGATTTWIAWESL